MKSVYTQMSYLFSQVNASLLLLLTAILSLTSTTAQAYWNYCSTNTSTDATNANHVSTLPIWPWNQTSSRVCTDFVTPLISRFGKIYINGQFIASLPASAGNATHVFSSKTALGILTDQGRAFTVDLLSQQIIEHRSIDLAIVTYAAMTERGDIVRITTNRDITINSTLITPASWNTHQTLMNASGSVVFYSNTRDIIRILPDSSVQEFRTYDAVIDAKLSPTGTLFIRDQNNQISKYTAGSTVPIVLVSRSFQVTQYQINQLDDLVSMNSYGEIMANGTRLNTQSLGSRVATFEISAREHRVFGLLDNQEFYELRF